MNRDAGCSASLGIVPNICLAVLEFSNDGDPTIGASPNLMGVEDMFEISRRRYILNKDDSPHSSVLFPPIHQH